MVVNGTRESDWNAVLALATKYDWVIPSIGLHPWYVPEKMAEWQDRFEKIIDSKQCAVGEIGLDRWVENHDVREQEEVFRWQLQHATKRDLPVSIHCLKAWGSLHEVLKSEKLPNCGFLIHSYGGAAEMIPQFADLGGYFSLSGYFAHERKSRQRDVFRQVPLDRLLLETDAPDMLPPPTLQMHFLSDSRGVELNHPANIPAVYEFASELYSVPMEELAFQIEANFMRLFGQFCGPKDGLNR